VAGDGYACRLPEWVSRTRQVSTTEQRYAVIPSSRVGGVNSFLIIALPLEKHELLHFYYRIFAQYAGK